MTGGEAYLFDQRKLWEGSVGPSWAALNRAAVKLLEALHVLFDRGIDQAVLRETILVSCRDKKNKIKKRRRRGTFAFLCATKTNTHKNREVSIRRGNHRHLIQQILLNCCITMAGWVTQTRTHVVSTTAISTKWWWATPSNPCGKSPFYTTLSKLLSWPHVLFKGEIQTAKQQIHTPHIKHSSSVLLVKVFYLTTADKHPLAKHDKLA